MISRRPSRTLARDAVLAVAVLIAAVFSGPVLAGAPAARTLHAVDTALCPFPLEVRVTRRLEVLGNGAKQTQVVGPTEVTIRNTSTGRVAVLGASGSSTLEPATGNLRFSGHQLWLAAESHLPFLSTDGTGSKLAPGFVVRGADLRRSVLDPCALVSESPPPTGPVTTPAPWGLPDFPLSRIAYAGMAPLIGKPYRHDHLHLDLIVDGRKVTIPAGIGQAAPEDVGPGPCPPPPESRSIGDCAPGHYFTARVAASPLQTHTRSGIVHLQSELPRAYTLGQFFDEWGVRFSSSCVGGHCAGGGKALRVFVNGARVRGDPRRVVLLDGQQIAIVFGGPAAFRAVPARYTLRMPAGCGGPGERRCLS